MSLYLHWPLDISVAALKEVEAAVRAHISYMQDDNARRYHAAQRDNVKPEYRWPSHRITELLNIANEARAMIQQVAAGARKVERRPAPADEDELLG